MWLTTKKNGLFVYYNDSLYTLPLDRNGYLLAAHCILEGDHGFFWISCNRGVFQVSKSDLFAFIKGEAENVYYYLWGLNDGIDGYELNGGCSPCGLKLKSGLFSFAFMAVKYPAAPPPIIIILLIKSFDCRIELC